MTDNLVETGWRPTWIEHDGAFWLDYDGHRLRVWHEATISSYWVIIDAVLLNVEPTSLEAAKDAALYAIGLVRDARGGAYSKRMVPRT